MQHVDSSHPPWTMTGFFQQFTLRRFVPLLLDKDRHARSTSIPGWGSKEKHLRSCQCRRQGCPFNLNWIPLWMQSLSTAGLPSHLSWDFCLSCSRSSAGSPLHRGGPWVFLRELSRPCLGVSCPRQCLPIFSSSQHPEVYLIVPAIYLAEGYLEITGLIDSSY